MFPSEKRIPIMNENETVSRSRLLFCPISFMATKGLLFSIGAKATADGGLSGFSLKIVRKKMQTETTM